MSVYIWVGMREGDKCLDSKDIKGSFKSINKAACVKANLSKDC